ncbi:hypothetical protein [Desulfosarcina alkanivorans]|nr:hypothetical protein [Desulfosarcina alkanivorans]
MKEKSLPRHLSGCRNRKALLIGAGLCCGLNPGEKGYFFFLM